MTGPMTKNDSKGKPKQGTLAASMEDPKQSSAEPMPTASSENVPTARRPSAALDLSGDMEAAIDSIDSIVEDASLAKIIDLAPFRRAVVLAKAVHELRLALRGKPMAAVMMLQGSHLGFRTDKNPREAPYPEDVVRDCLIEAVLRGLNPVGNEFNIIAGQMYMTREGLSRLVRDWPGLNSLIITPDLPKFGASGATVRMTARWRVGSEQFEIAREFAIRVNKGQGADAVLGKAKRKMYAAIYEVLTGSEDTIPEGDADDANSISPAEMRGGSPADAPAGTAGIMERLGAKKVGADADAPVPEPSPAERDGLIDPDASDFDEAFGEPQF